MTTLSDLEINDLYQAISDRLPNVLLQAIIQANRTEKLPDLLRLLQMSDLIDDEGVSLQPTRVVVIGGSRAKVDKLRSIARKKGFDPSLFDFALDYREIAHFDFRKLRDTLTYRAVMVGPMPHSTPGKRDASSAIAEMKANPKIYPPVIELRDSNGLKITNNSFTKGLDALASVAKAMTSATG